MLEADDEEQGAQITTKRPSLGAGTGVPPLTQALRCLGILQATLKMPLCAHTAQHRE